VIIWKGEALGNDYLVVERADLPWPLTAARCAAICDRHTGLGSDGILIRDPSTTSGFRLQILNPDGSEAEKSGNGLRIFGAYLHGLGLVTDDWFSVHLVKDTVRLRVERDTGREPASSAAGAVRGSRATLDIRVEMGKASFRGSDVAFQSADVTEGMEVVGRTIQLTAGGEAEINTVSLGNPHCVVLVENLDRQDFLLRAPQLCTHNAFAHGTNVQFAHVLDDRVVEILIWERGVGETLASGSSACAAACAAVRRGLMPYGRKEVRMTGGTAEVEVLDEYDVRLRGPARMVYRAEVTPAALTAWGELA
jgi:diaminopimelate epimerase